MINLKDYLGKNIEIEYFDGEKVKGYASGYTSKYNDEEGENLTLETKEAKYYCVYENEIKSIKIIL